MLEHFKNNKKFKINLVVKDNANNKEHLNNINATLQKEVGSDLTVRKYKNRRKKIK